MKIWANIPVEKIQRLGCFSFRHEVHEVEVIRVLRYASSSNKALNRWRYQADIKDHPLLHAEAIRIGRDGAYRVSVWRTGASGLNPKWVPPVFPDGCNWVEIQS